MGDERKSNLSRWIDGPEGFVQGANEQLDELDRRTSPGIPPPSQVDQQPRGRQGFWAELTDEPSSQSYSWTMLVPSGGSLVDASPAITGTNNAFEQSIAAASVPTRASTGGSGQIVWMRRLGTDGNGDPQYGFNLHLENASDQKVVGPTVGIDEEQESAFADTWSRGGDAKGFTMECLVRVAYDDTGSETLYAFYRTFIYDALGHLQSVSAETRRTIDNPEAC